VNEENVDTARTHADATLEEIGSVARHLGMLSHLSAWWWQAVGADMRGAKHVQGLGNIYSWLGVTIKAEQRPATFVVQNYELLPADDELLCFRFDNGVFARAQEEPCRGVRFGFQGDDRVVLASFAPAAFRGDSRQVLLASSLVAELDADALVRWYRVLRSRADRQAEHALGVDGSLLAFCTSLEDGVVKYLSTTREQRRAVIEPLVIQDHLQELVWNAGGEANVSIDLDRVRLEGATTVHVSLPVPPPASFDLRSSQWNEADGYAPTIARIVFRILDALRNAATNSDIIHDVTVLVVTNDADVRTGAERVREIAALHVSREQLLSVDYLRAIPIPALNYLGIRVVRDLANDSMSYSGAATPSDCEPAEIDLASLSPSEFEDLVAGLLERFGYKVQQTLKSWDGGVDCIAVDSRPLVGGVVIVQAKRYAGTVDASAVRDLFGTLHARGATKGILITSGTFGPSSWDFARGKPIELIDGVALRALLAQDT